MLFSFFSSFFPSFSFFSPLIRFYSGANAALLTPSVSLQGAMKIREKFHVSGTLQNNIMQYCYLSVQDNCRTALH